MATIAVGLGVDNVTSQADEVMVFVFKIERNGNNFETDCNLRLFAISIPLPRGDTPNPCTNENPAKEATTNLTLVSDLMFVPPCLSFSSNPRYVAIIAVLDNNLVQVGRGLVVIVIRSELPGVSASRV